MRWVTEAVGQMGVQAWWRAEKVIRMHDTLAQREVDISRFTEQLDIISQN